MISFVLFFLISTCLPFINNAFVVPSCYFQPPAEQRWFEVLTTTVNKPPSPRLIFRNNLGVLLFLSSSSSANNKQDSNDDDDDSNNDKKKSKNDNGSSLPPPISFFEKTVQSVTGDETYKFGDISKNLTTKAIKVEEEFVRSVTGNEQYKFGDITRNVTKSAINVTEETIKSVDQSTKSLLFESDSALMKFMDNYYMRISSRGLIGKFINDLSNDKESAMITTLQLIAFVGLTLHFVLNVCHSCSIIVAWGYACWKSSKSTLVGQQLWMLFLRYQTTIRIFVGPILLPLQVVSTFFLSIKYRDLVIMIENKFLPTSSKKKWPVISRCLALLIAWLFGNCLSLAAITYLGCFSVGKVLSAI